MRIRVLSATRLVKMDCEYEFEHSIGLYKQFLCGKKLAEMNVTQLAGYSGTAKMI